MIPKPSLITPDENDDMLVVATFEKPNDMGWHWERFYFRGAVCWPVLVPAGGGRVEGAVVMIGQHVTSGTVYVFEERTFACIKHQIGERGEVEYAGIGPAFSEWWTRYLCQSYWYHQPIETHAAYRRQVGEYDLVQPKPEFIPLDWDEDESVMAHVYDALNSGRVKLNAGGIGHKAVEAYAVSDGVAAGAMVRALMVGVYGMVRYPWRGER